MSDATGFQAKEVRGKEVDLLAKFQVWFDASKNWRQKYDWQWFNSEHYYRGNQYILFNKTTNQIITPPNPSNRIRLTINKIFPICRSIRNFATSYRPKWEVQANSTESEDLNNAERSADTLDFYYDYLHMQRKTKEAALHMAKYGVGIFQYGWDDDAVGLDNQEGEVDVWVLDPFDVYFDPAGAETGDVQNCRFIDKAIVKPVQEILNNPNYKGVTEADLTGTTKRAVSDYKNMLIQNRTNMDVSDDTGDLRSVVLHETWYKISAKKDGEIEEQVWVASWVEGHLLRNEQTEFEKYPIEICASDNNPGELYGEGVVKNLIPVQKALNRLESQILEYNNVVNVGRMVIRKDSGVSKITNETGDILEANDPNGDVRELRIGGLAPDIHQQVVRLITYMEDISGAKEAFMGGLPSGVTSGVALESLKAQSANNLQDFKDNLEDCLARVGQGILEMIAMHYVVPRMVKGRMASKKSFKIMGQVGVEEDGVIGENQFVIGKQNRVKVTIGSGLAYTPEGRRNALKELLQMKVIDPQTYLEHMEFGDVQGIVRRLQQQSFNDAMMQNISKNGPSAVMGGQQMQTAQMPPQGQSAPQQPDDWIQLARDEGSAMLNGIPVPPTPNATPEHTKAHVIDSQSEEFQKNPKALENAYMHIRGEEQQQGMPQQGAQQ